MAKTIERYESLKIPTNGEIARLPDPPEKDRDFRDRGGKYKIEYHSIEFISTEPPTGLKWDYNYATIPESESKYLEFEFMKLREKFVYENGRYILYLTEEIIKELFPEGRFIQITATDSRDKTSEIMLHYKTTLSQP